MTELHPLWEQAITEGRVDRATAEHLAGRYPDVASQICDTCSKLIVPNVEACYGAADPGPRHYECTAFRKAGHTTALEAARAVQGELGQKMKDFEALLGKVKGVVGDADRRAAMERDFDRIRPKDDGLRSGPVKR